MFGVRVFLGITLGISTTLSAHAVTLGQVQVQSAMNEPLKAKIPLSNLDVPASKIKAKLASANTYRRLGASPVTSGLNFSVQDAESGNAYILISSTQPIKNPFVDIVLDVNTGSSSATHQVPILLDPPKSRSVVSTRQPAPDASFYTGREAPLIPSKGAPPPMTAAPSVNLPKVSSPSIDAIQQTPSEKITANSLNYGDNDGMADGKSQTPVVLTPQTSTSNLNSYDATVVARQQLEKMGAKNAQVKAANSTNKSNTQETAKKITKSKTKRSTSKPQSAKTRSGKKVTRSSSRIEYRVVKNDTLWGIASQLSKKDGITIYQAMDSIQYLNQDAFIRGDANLIREGANITIPAYAEVQTLAREFKSTSSNHSNKQTVASSSSKSASSRNGKTGSGSAPMQASKQPSASGSGSASAGKSAPKKASKTQLAIVAPSTSGGAQGDTKDSAGSSLPSPIAAQVQNARQATVEQRIKVNQLNANLSGYSSKIKLQNTKLAELEKRLAELQAQSKVN